MPAKINDKGYKNLTLRLPDDLHRQLSNQATSSGHTLNGHLVNIVRGHLMDSGYYPNVIKSLSGRLYEVNVVPVRHEHGSRVFCSQFVLSEYHPLYKGERAEYFIGIDRQLLANRDPFGMVEDVGLALLNFYNRLGFELDELAWHQNATEPESPASLWKDNWRFIGSETTRDLEEFLIELRRNHWKDKLVIRTGQRQEQRYASIRNEAYFLEERPILEPGDADFERYAYDSAAKWLRSYDEINPDLTEEFIEDEYNVLPRYVQHQIDADRYASILRRCLNQLRKS
jgi:hypothetical protein